MRSLSKNARTALLLSSGNDSYYLIEIIEIYVLQKIVGCRDGIKIQKQEEAATQWSIDQMTFSQRCSSPLAASPYMQE